MAIEARSIDWVPETERHGRIWHQAPLWFLGNFQYFSIPIGFIGPSLGLSTAVGRSLAGVLGILVGTIFMAFHAAQGPTLGLPQMIQSRAQFGYRGVVVALFATLFTYLAFNVADQVLLAEGLNGAFGWNAAGRRDRVHGRRRRCSRSTATTGCTGSSASLLYISLPLMIVLTARRDRSAPPAAARRTRARSRGSRSWPSSPRPRRTTSPTRRTSATTRATSRVRRRTARSSPASSSARRGSAIWLIALGAWLAVSLGADDGLVGLMTAGNNVIDGLGDLAAFFSAAALAATMGMNAYGGMLTVLTAVDSIKPIKPGRRERVITIIVLAVVWYAIAQAISASAVTTVFTALTLMLYLLVPWTATNLVDFFFVRRGHYAIADLFKPDGIYGRWGTRGLIAYGAGFVCEMPFMVLPDLGGWSYTGPLAPNGVDIAWIVGLAVSAGVYWVLTRSLDLSRERPAEVASERELAVA